MMDPTGLAAFFDLYFHQDWNIEAETDVDVVRLFIAETSIEGQQMVAEKLRALAAGYSERELVAMLGDAGCCYAPSADALTYKQWLVHLAGVLDEAISSGTSTP